MPGALRFAAPALPFFGLLYMAFASIEGLVKLGIWSWKRNHGAKA